jgi:hypothetical protein
MARLWAGQGAIVNRMVEYHHLSLRGAIPTSAFPLGKNIYIQQVFARDTSIILPR